MSHQCCHECLLSKRREFDYINSVMANKSVAAVLERKVETKTLNQPTKIELRNQIVTFAPNWVHFVADVTYANDENYWQFLAGELDDLMLITMQCNVKSEVG